MKMSQLFQYHKRSNCGLLATFLL